MTNGATLCPTMGRTHFSSARDVDVSLLTLIWLADFSDASAACDPFFLWSPYVIGQTIIFLPCDFYLLLLSSFFFFSSPNLSGRRLDVYHTSTHGVGLKPAARGSLKMQDAKMSPKNRHLGTIAQLCRAISSQLRHISIIGKKLLSSDMSSTCPHNMVNLRPTNG